MKKSILTLFLTVLVCSLFARTLITDKQEVFGTWNAKGNPYIIEGEAIVPAGKILTIKPGVIVQFKTGTNRDYDEYSFNVAFLRVNGKIIAKGSSKKPIVFTRYGYDGNWGVVYVNSREEGSLFSWCRFEYGWFVRTIIPNDNATAALSFCNAKAKVSNCVFVNNGWGGINCKDRARPEIVNCTVIKNNYGIECNSESMPMVTNTIIWDNSYNFYINGSANPSFKYCYVNESEFPDDANDMGNNIVSRSLNPLFVDEYNGDFHLKKSSALYKKGMNNKNIGAY